MNQSINKSFLMYIGISIMAIAGVYSCTSSDDDNGSTTDDGSGNNTTELHAAFAEFDSDNVTIMMSGTSSVNIETNGLPNHTSPYWSSTNVRTITGPNGNAVVTGPAATDHPLYVDPIITSGDQMAPGNIDDFNGSFSLTVPSSPTLASSSSTTGLGAIGIAVSGSVIYNDE
ncbi:MAG: YHYH protein, partial [Nonlabens ulvanivorans]